MTILTKIMFKFLYEILKHNKIKLFLIYIFLKNIYIIYILFKFIYKI